MGKRSNQGRDVGHRDPDFADAEQVSAGEWAGCRVVEVAPNDQLENRAVVSGELETVSIPLRGAFEFIGFRRSQQHRSLLDPRLGFVELVGWDRDREVVVSVGCGVLDKFKPSRPECHDHNVGLVHHDVQAEHTCIKFSGFTSVSDTD